ncbi:hypothetical protein [Francisella philomiragia]|uniref:hypothetical protein n=1 Tax=Francisella philomiragia TaxID=28110 RepID=UPI001B8C105A|nr:hypothetical protein [Francisella philomiragia]QUE31648.1 hypothetical protein IMS64_01165 [Francisella philomiragia]
MKLRKLLLATTLAIPVMGYCGLIDWITGYPEIKGKIEQRLEQKYQGEKFDVSDVSYSDNLGGYNFDYKPEGTDYTYRGSYLVNQDIVSANSYMNTKVSKQWKAIFVPYVSKVSDNYLFLGTLNSRSPYNHAKMKVDLEKKTLDDLYNSNPVDINKWMEEDHNTLHGALSIFIAVPRTVEGVYKTLQMIEEINNKLRSMNLYSYDLEVITYDVPKGLDIAKYHDEVAPSFHTNIGWWFDKGIQKYAWGYLKIKSCTKIDAFEKFCNTQYGIKNEVERLDMVKKLTTADRINSLDNIVDKFRILYFGKPSSDSFGDDNWAGVSRDYIPLKKTKYYPQLEKLISENK